MPFSVPALNRSALKRLFCFIGIWVLVGGILQAQDYTRVAPKILPVSPPPTVAQTSVPNAKTDSEVILPKLKGLVFIARPNQVVKNGVNAKGVVLKDPTVPDAPAFESLAQTYIGGKFTRGRLNQLIGDIVVFYRTHDRPLVDVFVPVQNITSGTMQIIVLEGHVDAVHLNGNRWFNPQEIWNGVRNISPGDEVRTSKIQDDIDWLSNNPFHTTTLIYRPGTTLGGTDLEFHTEARFPARFYAGYEDSGNAATGFNQYEVGMNWGDAFNLGLGQQFNYQYTTSLDAGSLTAHSASYVIPLPWRNTITFFGAYTSTHGNIPPLTGINGTSYQISGRYNVPLPSMRVPGTYLSYKHSIAGGFDYKYNNNALEFGTLPAGGTLYSVQQFVISYNGTESDPYGQTTLDDETYLSPGSWGADNTDAAFNGAHTLATSNYVYTNLALTRLTRLPGDWTLSLRGSIQFATGNLAPSEQMEFGGYNTVRGYDDDEVNTDEGFLFSTEIRTPPISFGELLGHPEFRDQLQFLGFWDYGAAHNHTLLPGEAYETPLSSLGAGLRYNLSTYLAVRFDYGFQLLNTGLDNDHGSRGDVGVVVSY